MVIRGMVYDIANFNFIYIYKGPVLLGIFTNYGLKNGTLMYLHWIGS